MGQRHGNGMQSFNGMYYMGMFSGDQFHGHGVLSVTQQDGQAAITDGWWARGVLNGPGTLLNKSMRRHYARNFVHGALRGYGVETDMLTGMAWQRMF